MRALTISILFVLSSASTALAQDTPRSRASEVPIHDFDDELVEGGIHDSDYAHILTTRRHARRTLIRARTTFVAEMLKSVERL